MQSGAVVNAQNLVALARRGIYQWSMVTLESAVSAAPIRPGNEPLRRSLINAEVERARRVLGALHIPLPAFGHWPVEQWQKTGGEAQEVRDCMLGWDVTDFGSGCFEKLGRTLFTLRNGISTNPKYPKGYAEKFLVEAEGQRSPMHYHRSKREDIINRGGGTVIVTLYPVGEDGLPGSGHLDAQIDGITRRVKAGEPIRLAPGESCTIVPLTYHQFWAEEGTGLPMDGKRYTVGGEVSSVCDDWNDNVFVEQWAIRFPEILEDEPRTSYLCHEYPKP